jgi:hypothetical protein
MRPNRIAVIITGLLFAASPAFAVRGHRGPTSPKSTHSRSKTTRQKASSSTMAHPRGIDDERATQIQGALIKAGYLTGEPTGHWDSASESAMQKLQSDNGWQTKLIPDSRALIKLGLGPQATAQESASAATNANTSSAQ